MPSLHIYKNLAALNQLTVARAEKVFLDCCGSTEWARSMAASRPFPMLNDLYRSAEKIWFSLTTADHLEAFAAHPDIGLRKISAQQPAESAKPAEGRQARNHAASGEISEQLAQAKRLYEEKLGFVFVVCAAGKTVEEMLAVCRARLGNSVETELHIAAAEQAKITENRLNELLEK